jgi:DNA polymerase II large subunit
MSLSPTMRTFGGGINHEFSEAEETCILITFDEIYEAKKARHIDSYIEEKIKRMRVRFPLFVENMGEDLKMRIAQKRDQVQEKISETLKNRKKKRQTKKK